MVSPMDGTAGVHGHRIADESLLDDEKEMLANDPGGMLRATASAGAQVRESAAAWWPERVHGARRKAAASGPALPGTATPVVEPVAPPVGGADDTVGYTSARVKLTVPVPAVPEAEAPAEPASHTALAGGCRPGGVLGHDAVRLAVRVEALGEDHDGLLRQVCDRVEDGPFG